MATKNELENILKRTEELHLAAKTISQELWKLSKSNHELKDESEHEDEDESNNESKYTKKAYDDSLIARTKLYSTILWLKNAVKKE